MASRGRMLVAAALSNLNSNEKRTNIDVETATQKESNPIVLKTGDTNINEEKADGNKVDLCGVKLSDEDKENIEEIVEGEIEEKYYNNYENDDIVFADEFSSHDVDTFEEDSDDSVRDPNFSGSSSDSSSTDSSSSSDSCSMSEKKNNDEAIQVEVPSEDVHVEMGREQDDTFAKQKGKKIRAAPSLWNRNVIKTKRNKGEKYISGGSNPKEVQARSLRPPCNAKCKLGCSKKIIEEKRLVIFRKYWDLGNLQLQREFLAKHITAVNPTYRYKREGSTRGLNLKMNKPLFTILSKVNQQKRLI